MAEAIPGIPASETPPPDTTTAATTDSVAFAQNAYRGWGTFQQAVNTTLVQQLGQAESIRQATLRLLSRG